MSLFITKTHAIKGQRFREYSDAILDEHDDPTISLNQYTPISNPVPASGDVTFIVAGGIGFPKELYETFFDELEQSSGKAGYRIRNIWIADFYSTAASGRFNIDILGNDPSWFDHSRDLLHMINHFRHDMHHPLVGIGHSMGGCQISHLAYMHPRLFKTLVLLEPSIYRLLNRSIYAAQAKSILRRRQTFDSREAAAAYVHKIALYKAWDARVKEALIRHGFFSSSVPIAASSGNQECPVSISTLPDLEVALMFRPNFCMDAQNGVDDMDASARSRIPDADAETGKNVAPLYRPEPVMTFKDLPRLRPSVLYIVSKASPMSSHDLRRERMAVTGTGVGGSGGAPLGMVKEVELEGSEHALPMSVTHLQTIVKSIGSWVVDRLRVHESSSLMSQPGANFEQGGKRLNPLLKQAILEWSPKKEAIESQVVKTLKAKL